MTMRCCATQSPLSVERVGRRSYIVGETYSVRTALRDAGAHWDPGRKAWWLGKAADAQALVERYAPRAAAAAAKRDEQSDEQRKADLLARDRDAILGRATRNGHTYYLVGQGTGDRGPWVRLLYRDGSRTTFAPADEVQITARYQRPRTLTELQAYALGRSRDDAAFVERRRIGSECEARGETYIYRGSNPYDLGEAVRVGDAWYVVTQPMGMRRFDQDDAERQDRDDLIGGTIAEAYARRATADEAAVAQVERDAHNAKRDAAKAQAKAAVKAASDRVAELRAVPEGWTAVDGSAVDAAISIDGEDCSERMRLVSDRSTWTLVGEARELTPSGHLYCYARRYQAGEAIVVEHGSFDDDRRSVLIPPHRADAYLGACAAQLDLTRERAQEWLARYRGCVGTEIYAWAAEHLGAAPTARVMVSVRKTGIDPGPQADRD